MPNFSADPVRRAAVIVAAGRGRRAGGDTPKQYREIAGVPMLVRTYAALARAGFDTIVVVHAPGDPLIDAMALDARHVAGGATRTESVRAGLEALRETAPERVFIHDAARPGLSQELIGRLDAALERAEGAAPVLRVADALKRHTEDGLGEDVERESLRRVQTPQAFRYAPLLEAFERLDGARADDVAVALEGGLTVAGVPGEERNFKVTWPEDFTRMESELTRADLTPASSARVGSGYDVHRIVDGDHVWLGGVRIEAGFGLAGHSDADVALHALSDALLGACAAGDIGDHFPPTDPQWKGARSDIFLAHAVELCRGGIVNVDLTVICERPKVKPHREAMRARIAELCRIPVERVSVKATTTEGLGFTGRGEGIAAQATALVRL